MTNEVLHAAMGKKKQSKTGQCVYCGRTRPITEDHVPPKSLFAKPRPSNLIKVPSCGECHGENKQVSQDDEYFRLMLTLRHDVAEHPDVKEVLPTVIRSLARADKVGFKTALLRNLRKVDLKSRGGVYLGRRDGYNVDLNRLDRVAARITKGLFYHERGYRLPNEYEVSAFSESGLRDLTEGVKNELKEKIVRPLMSNVPHRVGNDVFCYRVAYSDTDPNVSAWLLLFYQQVVFLCLTLPHSIMQRGKRSALDRGQI